MFIGKEVEYNFIVNGLYMAAAVGIDSGRDVSIHMRRRNQPNKSKN